jgi:hypothetical protein
MKPFHLTVLGSLLLAPKSFAITDSNNNGLSDLWEKAYNNGQLFSESFDKQADLDTDGWTNAQEAAAGTNPFDPNPPDGLIRPEIAHIPAVFGAPDANGIPTVIAPEAVTVAWPTLIGKQYTLLFSPDLMEGSWIPIGDPFIGTGDDPPFAFQISDTDKRFWRVAVQDTDSDSDGLNDAEESELGTSTSNSDSDGDGIQDAQEILLGTYPSYSDTMKTSKALRFLPAELPTMPANTAHGFAVPPSRHLSTNCQMPEIAASLPTAWGM